MHLQILLRQHKSPTDQPRSIAFFPPCTPERTLQGGGKATFCLILAKNTYFFSRLRRVLGYPLSIKTCFLAFSESLLFFVQFKNIFSHHKVKNYFVCDGWPQSFPNEINIEILYIVLLNYSSEWFNWISPPQARKILRFCLPKTCFAL